MTCPTCNGPLAMLFTSTYCPACERARESTPEPPTALRGKNDSLYVGDDGELWWCHRGISSRLTYPTGHGPIVAFQIVTMTSGIATGSKVIVTDSVDARGQRWSHMHSFHGILPDDIEPKQWSKP